MKGLLRNQTYKSLAWDELIIKGGGEVLEAGELLSPHFGFHFGEDFGVKGFLVLEQKSRDRNARAFSCEVMAFDLLTAGRIITVRRQNTPMKIYHAILLGSWCFTAGCGKSAALKEKEYNQQHAQENLAKFQQEFALLDAAVQIGMTFSNASTILKVPPVIMKHDDGTFDADFVYLPRALDYARYGWLTNGFTLNVSNDIVIDKGYSYSSKR